MNEDFFLLDIPDFKPEYKPGIFYAYKGKGGENLKKLLTKTSDGYCMYCYTKILIDNKNFGELEHTIEKKNSTKLYNCLSNISIACRKCNGSFKTKDQQKRSLTKYEIEEFERGTFCTSGCTKPCKEYKVVRSIVQQKQGGKIIFQPYINEEDDNTQYSIQYDLLKQRFIPSKKHEYNFEQIEFIKEHIRRFNLNEPVYRTREISKFCEDVLEYNVIPRCRRYDNMVVDLLIKKLNGLSIEQSKKICSIIYSSYILNSK